MTNESFGTGLALLGVATARLPSGHQHVLGVPKMGGSSRTAVNGLKAIGDAHSKCYGHGWRRAMVLRAAESEMLYA